MKNKIVMISLIIFATLFGLQLSASEGEAEESGWMFNWYSFGYSGQSQSLITLDLYINCSFPENRPHLYEPYPEWNPGYYLTTETFYLKTPYLNENISGEYYGGNIVFPLATNFPRQGQYIMSVRDEKNSVIFSHKFTMSYQYDIDITELEWMYDCTGNIGGHPSSYSSTNTLEEKDIASICGCKLSFVINNTGDIPYLLGIPTGLDINIDYQFTFKKNQNTTILFTSEKTTITRSAELEYYQNDWQSKTFLIPGESIKYSTDIIINKNSLNLAEYGPGDYRIDGYIYLDPDGESYKINSDSNMVLTINKSSSTPGFELVFVLCAIGVSLFLWRKKRSQ